MQDPVWPMYREKQAGKWFIVCRTDTFDIRVLSLNPLDYIVWLGRADAYPNGPPANWWE